MLQQIIEQYKASIAQVSKDELYKWRAVKWFQDHWDIDAADFSVMLSIAIKKAVNLLNANHYYAGGQIEAYARLESEVVRDMFRRLYNETTPLELRILDFIENAKKLLEKVNASKQDKKDTDYQNMQAISVYLTFRYPNKYYIYKAGIYTSAAKQLGYTDLVKKPVDKLLAYNKLCDDIQAEVMQDTELLQMSRESLTADCYPDEEYRLLAQNIAFLASNTGKEIHPLAAPEDDYWPSLDEYDPEITTEQWLELLKDKSICPDKTLLVLAIYMAQGGEATCAHLASVYSKTPYYYNGVGRSFAQAVHMKTNCLLVKEEEKERYFPVVFQGRHIKEGDLYSWRLRPEIQEALSQMELPELPIEKEVNALNIGKNTILYGPPGTGKTWHTTLYAVAIVEEKSVEAIAEEAAKNYDIVAARYRDYKERGLIAFTTFHQSYGYEEFIEGIKPEMDSPEEGDGEPCASHKPEYRIIPGTFKQFCEQARKPLPVDSNEDFGIEKDATIWKVSLGGTGDNNIRSECMENNHIRIGWDDYGPDLSNVKSEEKYNGKTVLNAFYNAIKPGDVVLSCYSEEEIDAVGIVTTDVPEWKEYKQGYNRLRNVRWLVKGIRYNIVDINNGRNMTLSTVYRMKINPQDVIKVVAATNPDKVKTKLSNCVYIIDEINRGNISKIFGELITLIEDYKREGRPEAMSVVLPYSKQQFSIPNNLYLLGTMNTADRSIALIDTALRRRFQFVEMQPNPDVLDGLTVEGCDISGMLSKMNRRIEVLYDREHTIGHAYFMPLKQNPTVETLASIFKNRILPLLAEYFFEDFGKIRLVLSDNQKQDESWQFVKAAPIDFEGLFGKGGDDLVDGGEDFLYTWNEDALTNIEAYKNI